MTEAARWEKKWEIDGRGRGGERRLLYVRLAWMPGGRSDLGRFFFSRFAPTRLERDGPITLEIS